tara:strand:- start:1493 stop:1726 length:234 start_codon:yes stop_codon:yes gene_type:complete
MVSEPFFRPVSDGGELPVRQGNARNNRSDQRNRLSSGSEETGHAAITACEVRCHAVEALDSRSIAPAMPATKTYFAA